MWAAPLPPSIMFGKGRERFARCGRRRRGVRGTRLALVSFRSAQTSKLLFVTTPGAAPIATLTIKKINRIAKCGRGRAFFFFSNARLLFTLVTTTNVGIFSWGWMNNGGGICIYPEVAGSDRPAQPPSGPAHFSDGRTKSYNFEYLPFFLMSH